ncbi:hypothetical protein ABT061_02815 [Streptosporangium sp. NPDC002544]|uniref:hypothetical protein n=1 Tax=Streptosporangium sp. NPDC002544 TaxID=3154538 RepID=UPI00331D3253
MLLFKAGLDDADKWASVIGVFVGLLGLILSGYGVMLSHRALQSGLQATGVQVTASGTRSIAGQTISGNVSTGDTVPPDSAEKDKTPAGNAPQAGPAPATEAPQTAGAAQVTVTASGERSIAAQTISGTVSTGDNATGNR